MSTIGLLNPTGAVALVAIAVLIALYLYERRRRVIPVATLFLWKRVPAHQLERQRFRPDALFFLQLALLLALIGGYVRPYVESAAGPAEGAPLLVVLDASASMQAREEAGTRFDLARRRVRDLVARLGSDDEVTLILAAERPHVALRWSADRARLQDRLEALAPLDTPTNLAPALELALAEARARPGTRIAVLTDLPPEASGVAPQALAAVDYFQVGRTDDNVAIASLTVDRAPFHGAGDAAATVLVRNFGRFGRRVVLEARLGAVPWGRRELTLAPRASEHVLLTHPPRAGELEVTLVADDALAVDNRAVAWIPPGEPLDVLLVSDSRELAAAFGEIAAAIAGSRVEVVSRARYDAARPEGRRVAVFDGFVPAELPPAVNALYVAPPPGNPMCPSARTLEGAAVIDWDGDHPAVRGLDALEALEVTRASQLATPAWGVPVVLAASRRLAFPFLVTGERDGRRLACLGAELSAPLASSDKLPLLMLTLGTLRWLAEPYGGGAVSVETGVPMLAGAGPTGPVSGPYRGAGLRVAGNPPVLLAERVGTYRVGPPGGERLVFANLFDDRESDIGRDGGGEWPATALAAGMAPTPPSAGKREIGWWLYAAAAALLAIEWLVWLRREPRP